MPRFLTINTSSEAKAREQQQVDEPNPAAEVAEVTDEIEHPLPKNGHEIRQLDSMVFSS